MNWTHIITIFVSLFVISNPIGNLPIFLSLTSDYDRKTRFITGIFTALAVLIILLITAWVGVPLLHFFGINLSAFRIAGGIIIFVIGFSMLRSQTSSIHHTDAEHKEAKEKRDSIAVVPMAMPIMAGPGVMSTLIVYTHDYSSSADKLVISLIVVVLAIVIAAILSSSGFIARLLHQSGIKILTRIMGMVLMSIAATMIINGIGVVFPGLLH